MISRAIGVSLLAAGMTLVGGAGVAHAAWIAGGGETGFAAATTVGAGSAPTVTVNGRDVTVSWSAATLATGAPVSGYTVRRFDTGDTPQPVGAGCSGTIAALGCTEQGVAAGVWTYTVTPVQGAWTGAEGPRSGSVTVGGPALALTPAAFSFVPVVLTGTVSGFVAGETIAFRLDDPVTGTILTSTMIPDPIPTNGSASVTVTISVGMGAGAHTLYAVGSLGTQASMGLLRDDAVPGVSAAVIQKVEGGAAGFVRPGGEYYVYANVADNGSPASGLQSVTANASALTSGQTEASMTSGIWTVASTTYNYRSSLLTADPALVAGAGVFSITATDLAANVATAGGFSVTVDGLAPSVTAVVQKAAGGVAGSIRQGGQYYVYADVADAGGAGVGSVTADVSTVTVGQTAAPLVGGSWTVGGTTFNYRSAVLTADDPLVAGAAPYEVTVSDGAGNVTATWGTVTVDNSAPFAADVQTANAATGVAGRAGRDDTITFTYSEPMEPTSFLAGWTGDATSVTVRLDNVAGADRLRIFDASNTTVLPFGSVSLGRADYTSLNRSFSASTMTMSGNAVTITLGTPSGATRTAAGSGTMTWTPSVAVTDVAGNAGSPVASTESGPADREF